MWIFTISTEYKRASSSIKAEWDKFLQTPFRPPPWICISVPKKMSPSTSTKFLTSLASATVSLSMEYRLLFLFFFLLPFTINAINTNIITNISNVFLHFGLVMLPAQRSIDQQIWQIFLTGKVYQTRICFIFKLFFFFYFMRLYRELRILVATLYKIPPIFLWELFKID